MLYFRVARMLTVETVLVVKVTEYDVVAANIICLVESSLCIGQSG